MGATDSDQLNSFLRSEMLAVEVYDHTIPDLDDEPSLQKLLKYCRESHQVRADWLRSQIRLLGEEPTEHLGSRATAKKLVERGAALLGTKASLMTIEEGESRALEEYEREIQKLSEPLRALAEPELLPAQRDTHAKLTQITSRL